MSITERMLPDARSIYVITDERERFLELASQFETVQPPQIETASFLLSSSLFLMWCRI